MKYSGSLVFGMVDGVTLVLGLFLGMALSKQTNTALWHAALGGGLAELGGMSLGAYWADKEAGKLNAALNGAGCCLTTIACGVPFVVTPARLPAALASSVLILMTAVAICFLREETGWLAVARTFGLLAVAGAMSGASALA